MIATVPAGIRMTRRRWLTLGVLAVCALLAAEGIGRVAGLHHPVLYEVTGYGYRVKPGQDIRRFGNRYFSNAFGLRSESTTSLPGPGVLRILCLGDSLTNGGAVTDQAETYPYFLNQQLGTAKRSVEVLNASAPGWAIANELGWLQANGTFGASVVILTMGGADLYQPAASSEIVGHHPSFPSDARWLALHELGARYLLPRLFPQSLADPGTGQPAGNSSVLDHVVEHVLAVARYARSHDATPVILYVERPGQVDLSNLHMQHAKSLLFAALARENISVLSTREAVEQAGGTALFRDGLHPNAEGNRVLALTAAKLLERILGDLPAVSP
ncbi:MAG: SGNH/GDSL hydrolase family protein [Burkholderiales bacterium]